MSSWRFPDFPLGNIPYVPSNGPAATSMSSANSNPNASLPKNHPSNASSDTFAGPSNNDEGYQGDWEDQAGDPRNIRRQETARKEKPAAENLLHAMIREFLAESGHYFNTKQINATLRLPDGPNQLSVESYANRIGTGPSQDHPLLSWNHPISHPWNIAVIRILTAKFRAYAIQNGLPKFLQLLDSRRVSMSSVDLERALDGVGDVEKLIVEKLGYQQTKFRGAMRNIHSMRGKTDAEIGGAMLKKTAAERTRARRSERRRNLFVRRAAIIEEQLRRPDSELWQQINLIFAYFGDEDISSDETDIEKGFGAPKVTRRVRKAWISSDVTKIFHFIDGHYNARTITGTLKKGSAPLKRERESYKCNAVAPPRPMLPINFYGKELGDECLRTLEPKPIMPIPQVSLPESEMEVDP